ncbi:prolyl oligopeptidase family serine peptidase [Flavobacterium terrae]|nr:prolyl oligopeptidase family serine peptidase [Flavobacterium terrae]
MQLKFILTLLCFNVLCSAQDNIETKKVQKIIKKFNHQINDEYAWLEDTESEEVKKWVSQQNAFTQGYYSAVKKRVSNKEIIRNYDMSNSGSLPVHMGKYFYKFLSKDRKKSASLFISKSIDDKPVEIIDPNKIYPEKNVNIEGLTPSKSSNYLAYQLRINGSDKKEVRFYDLNLKREIKDSLLNSKSLKIAWNKELGVFYMQNVNQSKFAKDSTFNLYYHKLNTPEKDDELVYDGSKNNSKFKYFTTRNYLYLLEENEDKTKTTFYYSDLNKGNFELKKFYQNNDDSFEFINYYNGRIYYSTNKFNWGEVRSFAINNKEDDKQVIPQYYNHLLTKTSFTENYLICKYKTNEKSYLSFYNYDGKFIKKIEAPFACNINIVDFEEKSNEVYFVISSYTAPTATYKVNIDGNNEATPVYTAFNKQKPTLFPLDYFTIKCITYKNRDNIDIPITIIYKKGIELNGDNPCLLEAYGGFGIINGPKYDTGLLHFMDKGGIYAFAEIRGGGERGKNWHKKGSGINKINCLNDFIDATEFLIKEKYTNSNKLAISGGSHGGLVVGYAMTERPDLYKLALPKVGVYDVVNKFDHTVGIYHYEEYGNPNIEEEFNAILKYSPLHKIKEGINYPKTVVFTADNDDRVPPFQSYKFVAALKNRAAQKRTILLSVNKGLGHYGGNTYDKKLQERAMFYDILIDTLMR